MNVDKVIFVAFGLSPGVGLEDLSHFHTLAQRLGALHGHPSHPSPGQVLWSCDLPSPALEATIALLGSCPQARAALTCGEPVAVIPLDGDHPLVFGPETERALAAVSSLEPGTAHLSDALLEALGELDLSSIGFTPAPQPGVFVCSTGRTSVATIDVFARWDEVPVSARARVVVGLVERAIEELWGTGPLHELSLVHAHIERVVEVVTQTRARDPEVCARLLVALGQWINPVWMRDELVDACAELVAESSLAAGEGLERRLDLHLLRARQLSRLGEFSRVDALLERILDVAKGHPTYQAQALLERANTCLARQEVDRVTKLANAVLSLLGDTPSRELVRAHKTIAVLASTSWHEVATSQERHTLALHHLERAYTIAHACGDRQFVMLVAGEWADVLSATDPERAAERMSEVLELARALHVDHFVTVATSSLIELAIRRGRWPEAHDLIARAHEEFDASDLLARWHVLQQEALVALYEGDHDRAAALTHQLRQGLDDSWHPQVAQAVSLLDLHGALLGGQYEQFRHLLGVLPIEGDTLIEPPTALAAALKADGGDLDAALDRLSVALARADAQGELSPWTGLVWRHAIAHYPGRFVPAYGRPCVAVGRQGSWLVNAEGERTELAHRSYLRRLLCAFVELHARCDAGAFDTHEVFERGWPGEQVTLEAMKNRVYVGISKLRGFGLRHWLVSGPDGYFISPELLIIESPNER